MRIAAVVKRLYMLEWMLLMIFIVVAVLAGVILFFGEHAKSVVIISVVGMHVVDRLMGSMRVREHKDTFLI